MILYFFWSPFQTAVRNGLRATCFAHYHTFSNHSGTLFLGSSYYYLFENIAHVWGICRFYPNCIFVFVFVYLCICIVYLHVRDLWTLLFRSWYHFLFKKIALVGSICKFDQTVFVYLYLCFWPPNTCTRPIWPKKCQSVFFNFFVRPL